MKKKVIVAGHICLDITPVFQNETAKSVEQIFNPGKLIQMGNADELLMERKKVSFFFLLVIMHK